MGDGALGARPELLREQREELFEKKSAIESRPSTASATG